MICGSSGIANWRSRRGHLDPAWARRCINRHAGFGSNFSGVVMERRYVTCDVEVATDCVARGALVSAGATQVLIQLFKVWRRVKCRERVKGEGESHVLTLLF